MYKILKNKWFLIGILFLCSIPLFFIYKEYNPTQNSFFPKCVTKTFLGVDCPGCGSQRAFHQLLNGNIGGALHYNPLFVLSLPYLALGVLLYALSPTPSVLLWRRRLYGYVAVRFVLILVILFTILRNTPWAFW